MNSKKNKPENSSKSADGIEKYIMDCILHG